MRPDLPGPPSPPRPRGGDLSTIGKVTSAVYSPRLARNVALAMVAAEEAEIGARIEVAMRGGTAPATIVDRPFFDPMKRLAAAS